MTRTDVVAMLKLLKVAYPTFYSKMNAKDGADTVAVWEEMFRCEDVNVVKVALYKLIEEHTGYPPNIGDIKQKIAELKRAASGESTDEEMWNMLMKAISNGIYGAQEEYEKLPPVLQRYLGSPSAIRDMAMIDTDTLRTVNHGQFLKQISMVRQRQEFDELTPPEVKAVLARAYKPMENHGVLSDADYNDKRNSILNQLESGNYEKRRAGQN